MSLKVGVLGTENLGQLLSSLPGWRVGKEPVDVLGSPVVVADVRRQFTFEDLRAELGSQVQLLLAKVDEGGSALSPAVFLCPWTNVSPEALSEVVHALEIVGCEVSILSLEQLNLVDRLIACLPAVLKEAMFGIAEGAVQSGLPAETAQRLMQQTLVGTAVLLSRTQSSPALLKDRVASPAGTTIAALAVLEERAVRGSYIRAVEACAAGE